MEKQYILSVLVNNHEGVLVRISGLLSRRFFNIISIVAAQTEDPAIPQIIIVVQGNEDVIDQVKSQLEKLIDILHVKVLDRDTSVVREHLMIKVRSTQGQIGALVDIANMFKAGIMDVTGDVIILELTGDSHTLDSFIAILKPYPILKMIRTGCSAMSRGEEEAEKKKSPN